MVAPSQAKVRPVSRPLDAKYHIGYMATITSVPAGTSRPSAPLARASRTEPAVASATPAPVQRIPPATAIHSSRIGRSPSAAASTAIQRTLVNASTR